jgi:hypothetical protein
MRPIRVLHASTLLVPFLAGLLEAGTTGSLSGFVVDAGGDPVIGSSVMVEGTFLGAVTGAGGEYHIYALDPGYYTVTARMLGVTTLSR